MVGNQSTETQNYWVRAHVDMCPPTAATCSTDINNTSVVVYSWTTSVGTVPIKNVVNYSTKALPNFEDEESLRLKKLMKQEIRQVVRQSWKTVRHKEIVERKLTYRIDRPRRMMFSMSGWLAPVGRRKRSE